MSTRAYIGIENNDHSITAIYNHHDGYPSYLGKVLIKDYNKLSFAQELINLGDVSFVGENINPKTNHHSFDNPENNVCIAYHRDRGEEFTQHKYNSPLEYLEAMKNSDAEYCYLFTDSKWYYSDYKFNGFTPLEDFFEGDEE